MYTVGLVIGISYLHDPLYQLPDSIQNAHNMTQYLLRHRKFDHVYELTDTSSSTPTYWTIVRTLYTIIQQIHQYSSSEVWICYAGHSTCIHRPVGDKQEEGIVPLDVRTRGVLNAETLWNILQLLPTTCTCLLITDGCYREANWMHLPYTWPHNNNDETPSDTSSQTDTGPVARCNFQRHVHVSHLCTQNTRSTADGTAVVQTNGVLNTALLTVLQNFPTRITCVNLLAQLQCFILRSGQRPCIASTEKLHEHTWMYCTDHAVLLPRVRTLDTR